MPNDQCFSSGKLPRTRIEHLPYALPQRGDRCRSGGITQRSLLNQIHAIALSQIAEVSRSCLAGSVLVVPIKLVPAPSPYKCTRPLCKQNYQPNANLPVFMTAS